MRAKLRILEAIEELERSRARARALPVRAAVNTGEAVVALAARPAEGEGFVTGDVVNTAARLQQTAPVGALVVGEQTFHTDQARDRVRGARADLSQGKGRSRFRSGSRGVLSSFGIDVEQQPQAPLIGREHELALLRNTYSRMLRESSVQLVTLTGEPGIGKTRLVGDFRRFVDEQPQSVLFSTRALPALRRGDHLLGARTRSSSSRLEFSSPTAPTRASREAGVRRVAAAVEEVVRAGLVHG